MKRYNRSFNSSFEAQKVQKVLSRKKSNGELKNIWRRFIIGLGITSLLSYDLYTQAISIAFGINYGVIWFTELLLASASLIYTVAEGLTFFCGSVFSNYIDVTDSEKRLLGVLDNEPGFRKSSTKTLESTPHKNIIFSPSSYNQSGHLSPNNSLSPIVVPSRSPLQFDDSMQTAGSFSASFSNSFHAKSANSSYNGVLGTSADESMVIRQRISPARYLSPGRSPSCMTSLGALDAFLMEEATKENREQTIQADMNLSQVSSFWNVNRTVMDYVPMLRKFKYQVAPRSSQKNSTSSSNGDSDHPSKYPAHELWTKLGASQTDVDLWIENLRYWLGQTVMQRLAREITKVNKELRHVGSEDSQVGEVSVSTLKNVAFAKSSYVPTLNNVIPYLEVSSNQEYLARRIQTLGDDGCIADFNWDGGASFNGKPWEDHLPTDSAIVMHSFCTYLDARLLTNPKYPDGKAFSCQHFMSAQEKPNFKQHSDYLTLYQTKVNPPHYKVIIGKDIYDLPKGRNNLFHAILLFLHEIKRNKDGKLRSVDFGSPGINMLWIMTHKYR